MLPINEQNNNDNIRTAIGIFSEILVQMIDSKLADNIDTLTQKDIISINKKNSDEKRN